MIEFPDDEYSAKKVHLQGIQHPGKAVFKFPWAIYLQKQLTGAMQNTTRLPTR
jgi:hypothetical protein